MQRTDNPMMAAFLSCQLPPGLIFSVANRVARDAQGLMKSCLPNPFDTLSIVQLWLIAINIILFRMVFLDNNDHVQEATNLKPRLFSFSIAMFLILPNVPDNQSDRHRCLAMFSCLAFEAQKMKLNWGGVQPRGFSH